MKPSTFKPVFQVTSSDTERFNYQIESNITKPDICTFYQERTAHGVNMYVC
jgi:hypothetical protein